MSFFQPPLETEHSPGTFQTDIDTEFTSKASRALLAKQQEATKGEAEEAGGHKGISKKANDPKDNDSFGRDPLIGEHPAMTVPSAEESAKHRQDGNVGRENAVNSSQPASSGGVDVGQGSGDKSLPSLPGGPLQDENYQQNGGGDDAQQVYSHTNQTETQNANKQGGKAVHEPEVLLDEEKPNLSRVELITAHLNAQNISMKGTATDDDSMDEFRPHILHAPHGPVPIAMVNRMPKGSKFINQFEYVTPPPFFSIVLTSNFVHGLMLELTQHRVMMASTLFLRMLLG